MTLARVDRLVGGDQHEALAAPGIRRLGDHAGPQDVVAHRRTDLILQQGHMLVGGGVEDDLGALSRGTGRRRRRRRSRPAGSGR